MVLITSHLLQLALDSSLSFAVVVAYVSPSICSGEGFLVSRLTPTINPTEAAKRIKQK